MVEIIGIVRNMYVPGTLVSCSLVRVPGRGGGTCESIDVGKQERLLLLIVKGFRGYPISRMLVDEATNHTSSRP